MRKYTNTLVVALLLLGGALAPLQAAFERVAGDYVLASNVTLRSETWLQAHTLTLHGTAEDDLFLMSDLGASMAVTNAIASVRLGGAMAADVWALGDDVELSGAVHGHARLGGLRTVHVTGTVGRNLMAAANSVHLDEGSVVTGEVNVIARDVIAEGRVGGDLTVRAQTAVLGGHVDGDVTITSPDITVLPKTEIGGNFSYLSSQDLVLDSQVKVAGKLIRLTPPAAEPAGFTLDTLILQTALFLCALLSALLLFTLTPTFAFHSVDRLGPSVWRCLLLGFAACTLIPMSAVLLIFTVVGIPLGAMLLMVYGLLIYFSKVIVAFHVAQRLIRRLNPNAPLVLMPSLALGLLILYIAVNLPFPVGTAAWLGMTLLGVGGMVGAILDRRVPILTAQPAQPPPPPPPPMPGSGSV